MNTNLDIKTSLVNDYLIKDSKKIKASKSSIFKIFIFLLIIGLIILSIVIINFSFSSNGLSLFSRNLKNFFTPVQKSEIFLNQNLWILSFKFLFTSIKITFLGTTIGLILALITSYFSNLKMNYKFIAIPFKIVVILLRLLPELFFIYLFQNSAEKMIAINLIFIWFTWLWLHEYFSQIIENADFNIYYWMLKNKTSRFYAFKKEIWPQIRVKFFNYIFYAFESNIRWSTILSKLAFPGIGLLINPSISSLDNYYNELLIPLVTLLGFLLFLELSSYLLKKFFFVSKSHEFNYKKYQIDKGIKNFVLILLLILFITLIALAIKDLNGLKFYNSQAKKNFKDFFNPNWSEIKFSLDKQGIFWIVLELLALVFLTLVMTLFIAYFKMFLLTSSLVKKTIKSIFSFSNIFIRTIPVISLYFLISALYNMPAAAFVIVFSIHGASTLSRAMTSSLNNISINKIEQLKKNHFSLLRIYHDYVLVTIKTDLITFISFEIEKTLRNFITYGLYSASLFGEKIIQTRVREIPEIAPYLWLSFFILAIISFTSYLLRNNNYNKLNLVLKIYF
ncbi:ABC transporter permease [Mycoplasma struthionis]|uniref:ABC transporter permease n=1 Tax=Mycoplasma struthionis TaxID=538220 RepID=A0A502M1Z5_9MOLU|nr:ABC transporter permease [Mycoplasma struthionis]TPI01905.1 ABC transporter permease [Mycoplasma struthionis]